jgi:hypothetical protein
MTKLTKLGLDLVRMSWPVDKDGIQRTHFEACYVGHHACAIQRLADEVEMLRQAIGEFVQHDESGWHGVKWCDALDRLYEIADEAKKQS